MAAPTREAALAAVRDHLSERSLAHCEAVAEAAASLAATYGVDADDAWLAGLLHDWSRDVPAEELVGMAAALGIPVEGVDTRVPSLLHARVAREELARVLPGLGECVLDAVERHTVGAPDMTDLDKVVYVADMIEPARHFDGVDTLREAAGHEDLSELYGRAYALSLAHLVSARKYIHPDSVAAWNAIVEAHRT